MFRMKIGGMDSIRALTTCRLRVSTLLPAAEMQQGDVLVLNSHVNPTSAIYTTSAADTASDFDFAHIKYPKPPSPDAATTPSDSDFAHIKYPKQLTRVLAERSKLGFDDPAHSVTLFNRMVQIQPFSTIADFNELFTILVKWKLYPTAIYLIKRLRVLGTIPIDQFTLNLLLNCYCRLDRSHYGFSIVGSFFKLGYIQHQIALTVLMNGLIGEGKINEALELRSMLTRKTSTVRFDILTGATLMNALFKAGDIAKAITLLNKLDCIDEPIIYQTIINGLCKCGRVDSAMKFFSLKMFSPNACTFNSLIQGFANLGRWDDVKRMIEEMTRKDIKLDSYTFYVLMDILGYEKQDEVSKILKGSTTDLYSFTPPITFRPRGSVSAALQYQLGYPVESILEIISDAKAGLVAYNSLMKRYCLDGRMDRAVQVFDYLSSRSIHPNIFSYNSLINGYCSQMKLDEALQLYREIPQEGLRPNMETYNSLLKGLLIAGRCGDAEHIFHEMMNRGIMTDTSTYSTLLNSLCTGGSAVTCKSGKYEDPGELWYKWLKPDFCHEEIFNQTEELLLRMLVAADHYINEDFILAKVIGLIRRM